ncbi:ABC transporter substrate-binding protein [Anaerophaga thermohalophila]|uniref:ABC transporter substrate-binding protein n=1 Tax=Anaerophaga thermohalophila TaxID=177400 RepID=UPI0002FEB42F|nr:ABC transporter substrate-binding protein [Anaerophaga thermohalophila]
MVLKHCLSSLVLIVLLSSCYSGTKQNTVSGLFEEQEPDSLYVPAYAKGFSIAYYGDLKLIHVEDPWNSDAVGKYVLVGPGECPVKYKPAEIDYVRYPVRNWSAFSSTQIEFAEKIGVLETLGSVAEPMYISNSFVQKGVREGNIRNVGMAASADVEVLLDSAPQFVFVSPFKDNRYGPLIDAGLLVINDASYLEVTPLGRAEWLIFFSAFFDRENEALGTFNKIEKRYQTVKEEVKGTIDRSSVMTGYLFNDVWYMPAGDSFMATLFEDAGADYLYSERPGTGSLALDFETVFNDFYSSDFWVLTVNHSGRFTMSDLARMDERYTGFEAFKKENVLVTNTNYSGFFEKGIIEPDLVLKDLAFYFHPDHFPGYEPAYFHLLKE